jgi:glycosidase
LREGDVFFFYNTLTEIYSSYPKEVSDALWNILSTHDTKRIITSLAGESDKDKSNETLSTLRLSKEDYKKGRELLKIAAVIQYTVFGSPLLYYGDEVGLEGYGDPFCRLLFPWGKEDKELLEFFQELGKLRKEHPCLKDGSFEFTDVSESSLEYLRVKGDDKVRVRIRIKRF